MKRSARRPLQNRVSPFGELFADPARGTLFGNRGGRFHTDEKTLTRRRWSSRAWICCVLEFKNRHHDVWGSRYTALFFLDEPTAFAAGHRPCFECRRADATAFARAFVSGPERARAPDMDDVLHAERLNGREKRVHRLAIDGLPDGAFVVLDREAYAVKGKRLLRWTPSGYRGSKLRPRSGTIEVLTPPSMLRVLKKGYGPRWHDSAGR